MLNIKYEDITVVEWVQIKPVNAGFLGKVVLRNEVNKNKLCCKWIDNNGVFNIYSPRKRFFKQDMVSILCVIMRYCCIDCGYNDRNQIVR